jgi:hypothetical protein
MQTASNLLANFVAPASPVRVGKSRRCDLTKDVPLVQCSIQQQDRCRRQAANWTPKHVYYGNICRADNGAKQTGHTKLTDTARELDTAYSTNDLEKGKCACWVTKNLRDDNKARGWQAICNRRRPEGSCHL